MQNQPLRLAPFALAILMVATSWTALSAAAQPLPSPLLSPEAQEALQQTPVSQGVLFEKNMGQWDSRALFRVSLSDYDAFVTSTGFTLVQTAAPHLPDLRHLPESSSSITRWATKMELVGGNPDPVVSTEFPSEYVTNYFLGNDSSQWRTSVPHFHQVTVHDVYPGIDLVYHGRDGGFKYDFLVHPGGDSSKIRQHFDGANISVDEAGALLIETDLGTIKQDAPFTRQGTTEIPNRYVLNGNTVSYEVGAYDPLQLLIIDPLVYSTFLAGATWGVSVAVDSSGSAYVAGMTWSASYPTTLMAYQSSYAGAADVFVTKVNPAGSGLLFSTFLGGSSDDLIESIALDSAGNAYVTGATLSTNFPTSLSAYQASKAGGADVFVSKISSTGTNLLYSTHIGSPYYDHGFDIAVDSSGNAYVTGKAGWNFPTTAAAYKTSSAGSGAFVAKLNPAGTGLLYSTMLDNNGAWGYGIAVDAATNAYATGMAVGSFPITSGAVKTVKGLGDETFVVKLNPAGSGVFYSTYLGDTDFNDYGTRIAVDSAGNAYVTGPGKPQIAGYSNTDVFIKQLNPVGSSILFSTTLGSTNLDDHPRGIAIDGGGSVYIAGDTAGGDFPTSRAYQSSNAGGYDLFVARVNLALNAIIYSSYLGGGQSDRGYGLALDSAGIAYVTGYTYHPASPAYPTTSGAYQTAAQSYTDNAFVTKITPFGPPGAPSTPTGTCGTPHGTTLSWSAPANDGGGGVTSYSVYRQDGSTWIQEGVSATTTFTATPPWQAGAYTYKVTASNPAGEGEASGTANFAPCDSQAPTSTGGQNVAWTNAVQLSGRSWQDTYSGLQLAQYSVGTSSGATNVANWADMPVQPTSGQTSLWTPNWPLGSLAQGLNFINTRVYDRANNVLVTNGAYTVQFDSGLPAITGAPVVTTWTNAMPTLSGITWQDSLSGLRNTAEYSVGTTSGGTNVLSWRSLPAQHQPALGQTSTWSPSWSPAMLAQGVNHVNMRVTDVAGNVRTTDGAYQVQFDTVAPISLVASSSHPDPAKFYQATTASLTWTTTDVAAGPAGFYVRALGTASCPTSLVSTGTWQTGSSYTQSGLGPFGQYVFCVQPKDQAGNVGPVASFSLSVNTVPTGFLNPQPADGSTTMDNRATVRVGFDNTKGGEDLTGQLIKVDPALVVLEVDGVDVVAYWRDRPECQPVAGQPNPACPVQVDSEHVQYTPPTPWSAGVHHLDLTIGDVTVPPVYNDLVWSFTLSGSCPPPSVGVPPACHTVTSCTTGIGVQVDGSPTCIGGTPAGISSCAAYNAANANPYPGQNAGIVLLFDPPGMEGDVAFCAGTAQDCAENQPGVVVDNSATCVPPPCPAPSIGVAPECHTVALCSPGAGVVVDGQPLCQPVPVPCPAPSLGVQPFCYTLETCNPPTSVGATVNGAGACMEPCPAPSIGIQPSCHTVTPCESGVGVQVDSMPVCQPMPVPCEAPSLGVQPFCITVQTCNPPEDVGAFVNGIGSCIEVCDATPGIGWSVGAAGICLGLPWAEPGGNPECYPAALVNVRIHWGTTPGMPPNDTFDVCF